MRAIGLIAFSSFIVFGGCGPLSSTETRGQQSDTPPPTREETHGSNIPREAFHPTGQDDDNDDNNNTGGNNNNNDDRDGGVHDAGDGGLDAGVDSGFDDNNDNNANTNDPRQRWLLLPDGGLMRSDSGLGF